MSTLVTTLERIQAFAPTRSATVEEVAAGLRLNSRQARLFRRVHGLDRLRDDPGLSVVDLLRTPAAMLLGEISAADAIRYVIRYVILAHTIQEIAPVGVEVAQLVRRSLGLDRAEAFAITQQGCASGLAALDVAGELLRSESDPNARALVVTGEKPFSFLARLIPNTTIMGEASAAALVSVGGPGARVLSYMARVDGTYADTIRLPADVLRGFGETYAERLAAVIQETLDLAGLRLADIALIVPHNVNRFSWRQVIHRLGTTPAQVFLDNIPCYSHCFCADPFLNLVTLRDAGRLVDGGRYLLAAVGLGATYAAMLIEHREAR